MVERTLAVYRAVRDIDSAPMERRRFRELLAGDAPGPERIFLTSLWFKGHNNPRYAELLPRLSRLDAYLTNFSDRRIPRGLQYHAFRWSRRVRNPAVFALANRRYRSMLTLDNEQIRYFDGPVVADVDDPVYDDEHVALLLAPEPEGVRRHGGAGGETVRGARRRQALARDPAGSQPQLAHGRARRAGGGAASRGRGRRRLDGGAPARRRRPRRRQPALQRRPPARALGRDPRAPSAGPALARRRRERARPRAGGRARRHRPLRPARRASRRSRRPPTSTSPSIRARRTRASRPPRSASSSASASRPSRTTTR